MDLIGDPIYIPTGKRNRGPQVTTITRISNVKATGCEPLSGIQITGTQLEGSWTKRSLPLF